MYFNEVVIDSRLLFAYKKLVALKHFTIYTDPIRRSLAE